LADVLALVWRYTALVRSFVFAVCLLAACASSDVAPPARVALEGAVARVGRTEIPPSLVSAVASARKVTPEAALDALVEDALFAEGAERRGLRAHPDLRAAERTLLARLAIRASWSGSTAQGPPTDEELAVVRKNRWRELDRPVSIRTAHVLVQKPAKDAQDFPTRGRAVAEALLRELRSTTTPEDFVAKGGALPQREGFAIVAQPLPAFVADGRVVEGDGAMDPAFTRAAFELKNPGDTSSVVESSFGYHVIRLMARFDGAHPEDDELRRRVQTEVWKERGRKQYDALVARLRASRGVAVEPSAEELMRSVSAGSDAAGP
jgi:hypothetical protein